MSHKPILIVAGEPNSIFLEIFFKSINKNYFKSPLIIVVSKKLLIKQMEMLGFNFKLNLINENYLQIKKLNNKMINIIDVDYKFKKPFEKISIKSNNYISKCFDLALRVINKYKFLNLINGPISKKHFLKGKSLGITEYLAKKTKNNNNVAMLIYNKKLSVSPITTHLPLKNVHKNISKRKIYTHVKLINDFYKKNYKRKPKIAITGLNPHCESNFKDCEEDAIIIPAINNLKSRSFKVEGPFPADTIFLNEHLKNFDLNFFWV